MPIEIQKKHWRGCTVILKMSTVAKVRSPFFLVFNGKCHFAPNGAIHNEKEAVDWANQKALQLWKAMQSA